MFKRVLAAFLVMVLFFIPGSLSGNANRIRVVLKYKHRTEVLYCYFSGVGGTGGFRILREGSP
ncbi:MAG: hypothetical protein LBQ96_03350 [Fusobacteriaceae bacterium]|jgi:hypothetical protein|nr:hypothetical protein [Fusobacteriaceae bacterium]